MDAGDRKWRGTPLRECSGEELERALDYTLWAILVVRQRRAKGEEQ